ncbi:MAG TPA: S-layer family protein, partial [Leptolyngbyaceae cyanobacterium]
DALTISGTNDANRKPSAIFSSLGMGATGQGGDINIKTGSLLLNNGADLESSTSGTGNAGNIFVQAKESISLAGSGTAIYSDVTRSAVGNAGGIEIKARSMSMSDEAALTSSTWGQQNTLGQPSHAGKVLLQIDDALSLNNSTIFNNVEYGAVGQGGDIEIQAGSLSLLNSAQIQTIVRGAEDGQPAGRGDAGKVNIDVRDALTISGVSNDANKYYRSSINSILGQGAIGKGGDINIQAGSLSMKDGAIIDSSTGGQQDTSGQPSRAGDVTINVQGLIHLSGYTTQPLDGGKQLLYSSGISSQVGLGAIGNGGDVKITAGSLSMNDFSVISSGTFGRGNAGKVSMQVDDFIKLTNFSDIRSMVEPEGVGIGNDIDIKARSLTLIDGSQIGTTVFRERKVIDNGKEKILSGGIGSAGNIEINARDFINISGVSKVSTPLVDFLYPSTIVPTTGFSSGLFASAERGSTAISPKAAGNITVTTNDFRLTDGAVVNALTSNSGNAGNITINAKTFTATGGGQILTTTRSSGNAGDIILNISDNITLSGRDPNFNERIKQAQVFGEASDIVNNQGSASGIFGNTTFNSQGDGGKISIDPRTLVILDHAGIGVNSEGKGKGGDININSDNLTLDNHAFISAETASNQGGSIFLKIGDLLLLRRKSNISTNAGTAQAGGDGGDIKIDSDFIVALPSEDSNITANAFTGRGGNVNISATSIFGMKYRKSPTLRSDITASSQFGITGNVTLNTPNVDPSHGLVELPKNVVDPTEQIAQNPCQRGLASKFIITGRGGLPPSPNEATSSDTVRVDLVEPAPGGAGAQRRSTSPSLRDAPRTETLTRTSTLSGQGSEEKGKSSVSKSIVPAQGWIFDKNGEVMLTGYDPTGTGSQRPVNSDGCPVP